MVERRGFVSKAFGRVLCRSFGGLLLLVGLWLIPGFARAEIPAEWLGKRVIEARAVGDQAGRVDERELSVPRGAPLSRALVREAIRELSESGKWSDIQVDARLVPGGVELLFHLAPRMIAQRVDVAGNEVLDTRDVERIAGLREGVELDPEQLPSVSVALRETYATRGYMSAEARVLLRETDDPARKVVRIEIDEGPPTLIAEIVFDGDPLPSRTGLRRVLRFDVGDVADKEKITDDLRRGEELLRRAGFYTAEFGEPRIEVSGVQGRVIIPSHVGPHHRAVFRGNRALDDSTLFAELELGEERLLGEPSLRALESKLLDLYHRYGFLDAKVHLSQQAIRRAKDGSEGPGDVDSVALVFDIEPGEQTEVVAISFPGASHFEDEILREQIFSYLEEDLEGSTLRQPVDSEVADELGFGGGKPVARRETRKPLVQDPHRIFYAPTYAEAIEHIRELYRGDGYLRVDVSEPVLKRLPEKGKAVVAISINEGPRTFVYEVLTTGNAQLPSRSLLEAAGLERGTPFSYLKLEEARLRVLRTYQERGFFYATVEPRVRTSDDGTRAEINFEVVERFVVHVSGIEVRGAERSSKRMILNRVQLVPGEIYRPSLAEKTEESLLALDIFTSVTVAPEEADLPARTKTVVISVTERKSQYLGWTAGFSTGEGVRGGFEYGYRNLFGTAVHASFRGQLGYQFVFLDQQIERRYTALSQAQRIEYQATLSLGIPYIRHLPKNSVTVDLVSLQDLQRDFRIEKQSVIATLFYRPIRRVTFALAEEIESSDFYLFALHDAAGGEVDYGNLPPSAIVPEGDNTLASTQLTWSYDLRDRAYNPRRGLLLSLSSEWARTLTDRQRRIVTNEGLSSEVFRSNLLRFLGSVAFYVPLFEWLTFASQVRYGRIVHLEQSSRSYPNRLFYLGGTNFRGYYVNQMIPADLEGTYSSRDIVSRGGQTFIAAQSELRFPLIGDLYAGLFTDVGNLWTNPKNLTLTDLRTTVGAGLRFQTPIASLALDYGVRALDTTPFEVIGAFQFAFQTF